MCWYRDLIFHWSTLEFATPQETCNTLNCCSQSVYFSNGGVSGAEQCRLRARLTEIISNPHRTVRLEIGKSSFNFKAHEPPRATCGGRVTRSQMSTSIPLLAPKLYKNLAAWLLEQRKADISIAALEKQQWRAESLGQGKTFWFLDAVEKEEIGETRN